MSNVGKIVYISDKVDAPHYWKVGYHLIISEDKEFYTCADNIAYSGRLIFKEIISNYSQWFKVIG